MNLFGLRVNRHLLISVISLVPYPRSKDIKIELAGCSPHTPLGLGTHLFVKVPRPGDSEVTFSVFESSQAATCYYQSNHSKVEAIPLSALLKDTTKANLPA